MEQGTPEWLAARLGKITGTKAHNLLSSEKTRKTLLAQLFREIATAEAKQIPKTPAMDRGTALEPEARAAYTKKTGYPIHGYNDFIIHPDEQRFAVSPDGLAREDGGIEIKCREPEQHIYRMINGIAKDELHQIEWSLFCSPERQWWDYCGFNPDLPAPVRIFTQRVELTEARYNKIESVGREFLEELDKILLKHGLGF